MSQSNSHSSILSSTSWSNEMEDALPKLPSQTVTTREATTMVPPMPMSLLPTTVIDGMAPGTTSL